MTTSLNEPRDPGSRVRARIPLTPASRTSSSQRRRRRYLGGTVGFLAPAAIVLAIFRLVPVAYGVYLSLTSWNGFSAPQFTGLANYRELLHDPTLHAAVENNLLILIAVPVWVLFPQALAVLIHERPVLGKALKIAFVIPTLVSPALLGLCFSLVLGYDGPVNTVLRAVGLKSLALQWLADPQLVLWCFVAIMIYATFGIGVLFFSAGLATIDPDLHDAAAIDGASRWQRYRHVTVPHLRPVTEFWSVVVMITVFTATFPLLYTLTGGGPGNRSTTIDLYIYQTAFESHEPSYATALGMVTFVVVFVFILLQLAIIRRRQS